MRSIWLFARRCSADTSPRLKLLQARLVHASENFVYFCSFSLPMKLLRATILQAYILADYILA